MKNSLTIACLLILLIVVSCTPDQQNAICPPSPSRLVGADVLNVKIINHQDPFSRGNTDEPYIMNIGSRATFGRTCSAVAQNMSAAPSWAAVNWTSGSNGEAIPIPDAMGHMWFDSCWATNNTSISSVVTDIEKNGFQIFGNIIFIIEADDWPQGFRNSLQNTIRDAIQVVLQEVVETGGQVNQQNLRDRILFAISQINLRSLITVKYIMNELATTIFITDDANDDIMGVHMNLFLGLPDTWLDLTGITQNDLVTSVHIGEAISSAVNINGSLGSIVNPIIVNAEGRVDLRLRISGVGFSLPGTAADVNPVFNMYDKDNILKGSYELNLGKLADCTGSSVAHPNLLHKTNTCNP